ncbi:hypothetical protein ACUXV3_12430 [Roseobacteraceae bacterium NS-SX3]
MAGFYIFSDDPNMRLKSFSGTFNGAKGTLRINLEIDNPEQELGFHLRQLKELQEAQKAAAKAARAAKSKPKPQPKKITARKPLMLPAPEDCT